MTLESSALSPTDREYLEKARSLAHRGWGRVHPNPMVGCVLVRDGEIVGEGHHQVFGGPHAEIVALEQALTAAEGATAYVSLEPCDHQGKTPPCSQALIDAGVARVVYGAADPGRRSGGGADTLRGADVDVVGPVWSPAEAWVENPAFMHVARHETPFVALKLAMTLDARIAGAPEASTRITGAEAHKEVHRLRTGFDALLVGAGTARVDDPRLTVRLVPPGRQAPRRVVLAPEADLDPGAAIFELVEEAPLHVFTRLDVAEGAIERLEASGAHVHPVAHEGGRLSLEAVSDVLWELGIRSILCEGGGRLASSLLRDGRVQRVYLFVAPRTLGEAGVPAFPGGDTLDWSSFRPTRAPEVFGRDALLVLDREEA